jgi:hypothetical protein
MSLVQTLLFNIPSWLLGFLMVTAAVFFSVVGLMIIRFYIPAHKFKVHNDVAGSIFATLGVIYAVLLAFMVIVTWQNFDQASRNVAREANYIADLYRDTAPLSAGFHEQLGPALKEYVNAIVGDEWAIQARGERSEKVQAAQQKIWDLFGEYVPVGEKEKIFFEESVRKLNEACEMRRQRLLDATSGIHSSLYFVLVAGGIITILFTLFFGTENFIPHVLMTSMLAALIALTLFTIMSMDYPFTGSVSISPAVFKLVLRSLFGS